jgi:hypothetical protein
MSEIDGVFNFIGIESNGITEWEARLNTRKEKDYCEI